MKFRVARFSGVVPAISPRLVAEQFGQTAENIDFESGVLNPIKDLGSSVHTLQNTTRRSIFYHNDTNWLEWADDDVSVVEGPIADDAYDRIYWTGEDYPRVGTPASMISGSSGYPAASYRLGVPAPSAAPTLVKSGTADADAIPRDVTYVYTLVTEYGEEGPPSDPSTLIELSDGESVAVSMPAVNNPSGNYNFGSAAKKRIYRSNVGSTDTQYQFVAEVTYATTSYNDSIDDDALGEVIPSVYWIGPPDDNSSNYPDGPMEGLIPLSNGIFAGFVNKRLCLSEPYLPHAWPIQYRITMDEPIVGIASTASGIAVLTDGRPFFVTGVDPSAMTAVPVEFAQACVNERSVVDMGDIVVYASPDGLCGVSANEGVVLTRGAISPEQWNTDFYPTDIRAFRYEDTYVAFWTSGGNHGGWVYDPRATEAAISTLSVSNEIRGGYYDPKTGDLYVIEGSAIKKFRDTGASDKTYTWKSKKFVAPKPVSMGYVQVLAEAWPVTVKVTADGTEIANYTISKSGNVYTQATTTPSGISDASLHEPVMRLPSVKALVWEVEVSSTKVVNEVCIAQTMRELRSG